MVKKKNDIIYVFIDSQNLNLGTKKDICNYSGRVIYKGWNLDYGRFYRYLSDKFRVKEAFLFIGYLKENTKLYKYLENCGYKLIYKPTTKDRDGKPKGNVDAEIVLHTAAIEYSNYDKAIIVSGDGDFYCLHNFLVERNKLLKVIIPNRISASSLLKQFEIYKIFIQRDKRKLERRH